MFETLDIHKGLEPTVYLELLIGISFFSFTPPETLISPSILARPTTIGKSVDTEIVYGQGADAEYFSVIGGCDE